MRCALILLCVEPSGLVNAQSLGEFVAALDRQQPGVKHELGLQSLLDLLRAEPNEEDGRVAEWSLSEVWRVWKTACVRNAADAAKSLCEQILLLRDATTPLMLAAAAGAHDMVGLSPGVAQTTKQTF